MKTDKKTIKLIALISQFRDHIDVYRVIGLNVKALQSSPISKSFLGYLQKTAQESLAAYFCKIFESSKRHELNSIPGIIDSLPRTDLCFDQKSEFSAFGKKYGNDTEPTEAKFYLKDTFRMFCDIHAESLARLKEYRDTIGAHSDSKAALDSLPSHPEFETL